MAASRNMPSIRKIEPNPARAESRGLRVSSVRVNALSQPQKQYTHRMIAVAASLAEGAVNGLNQDSATGCVPWIAAYPQKPISTRYSKAISGVCSRATTPAPRSAR